MPPSPSPKPSPKPKPTPKTKPTPKPTPKPRPKPTPKPPAKPTPKPSAKPTPPPTPSSPTPKPKPIPVGKLIGGWTNCGTTKTWLKSWGCNTILTGRFGNHAVVSSLDSGYPNYIYTLGGAAPEDPSKTPDKIDPVLLTSPKEDLINLALKYIQPPNIINGLCFDIETGGGITISAVKTWLDKWGSNMNERLTNLRKATKSPNFNIIIAVPEATVVGRNYSPDYFTHIAPMAYSGNAGSYPQYDYFATGGVIGNSIDITNAIKSGFKTEQIIFTFQSFNASSYSGKENMFKNMADGVNGKPIKTTNQPAGPFNGSFGGILGWPAQLDKQPCGSGGASNADESNMEIITNYLNQ